MSHGCGRSVRESACVQCVSSIDAPARNRRNIILKYRVVGIPTNLGRFITNAECPREAIERERERGAWRLILRKCLHWLAPLSAVRIVRSALNIECNSPSVNETVKARAGIIAAIPCSRLRENARRRARPKEKFYGDPVNSPRIYIGLLRRGNIARLGSMETLVNSSSVLGRRAGTLMGGGLAKGPAG